MEEAFSPHARGWPVGRAAGTAGSGRSPRTRGDGPTYENQNLHGLLDWRLGLAYLRAFSDPTWACGLDGDFSWSGLCDWPDLARQTAVMTLRLWGGDAEADWIESTRANGLKLVAFRLPIDHRSRRPWVIVRHPLWRPDRSGGVLAEFRQELAAQVEATSVLCWDTFNLTRRPGRTRQWMSRQGVGSRRPVRKRTLPNP